MGVSCVQRMSKEDIRCNVCVCAYMHACMCVCVCVCVCVGRNTFRLWFTRLMAELFSMMFKVGVFLAVCKY